MSDSNGSGFGLSEDTKRALMILDKFYQVLKANPGKVTVENMETHPDAGPSIAFARKMCKKAEDSGSTDGVFPIPMAAVIRGERDPIMIDLMIEDPSRRAYFKGLAKAFQIVAELVGVPATQLKFAKKLAAKLVENATAKGLVPETVEVEVPLGLSLVEMAVASRRPAYTPEQQGVRWAVEVIQRWSTPPPRKTDPSVPVSTADVAPAPDPADPLAGLNL